MQQDLDLITAAALCRFKNDLDVKEIVKLWAGGSAAVKSILDALK